jgi:leucyl aminopeptidase (aminopeptidase T)
MTHAYGSPLQGLASAFKAIYEINEDSKIMIIYDKGSKSILNKVGSALSMLNYEGVAKIINLDEFRKKPLHEIPSKLEKALESAEPTHLINIFGYREAETEFRIKFVDFACAKGVRVAHCPGISNKMFRLFGPMHIDYINMRLIAEQKVKNLQQYKEFEILTGPNNAYVLTLNVGDREWKHDLYVKSGSFGNLPAGEIYIAPLEDSANGQVRVEHFAGGHILKKPVLITWAAGKVTSIESEDKKIEAELMSDLDKDPNGRVIGEFAIGFNQKASYAANTLEAEKSCPHIARGPQTDFGSVIQSDDHQDFSIMNSIINGIKNGEKFRVYPLPRVI